MAGRAVILQHEQASLGSVPEWAAARGFAVEILGVEEEWSLSDLEGIAFLASMGARGASYDDDLPWLARELDLLDRARAAELPVLGICFGSQSLARSLGARTQLAERTEIGWFEVETSAPALIPPGPWLFWHEDRFDVPAGAELLARTAVGPAAYRAGRSLAVQFHPEVTPAALAEWLDLVGNELTPAEKEALQRGMQAEPEHAVSRAWALYDTFLEIGLLV
jgi:GMP synthase-like glutamine amidotransferase